MVNPESQYNLSQEQVVNRRKESSDSESSDSVMDDRPDSLQSQASHVKSLDGTEASKPAAEPSEHTAGAQKDQTADQKEADGPEKSSGPTGGGESESPKSTGDKVVKKAPDDIPTQRPLGESKNVNSPSGTAKKTKTASNKLAKTREAVLDHNANMERKRQTTQKGKNKSKQETAEQKAVFSSQTPAQVTLIHTHVASWCSRV